jgi:hypothetical protein
MGLRFQKRIRVGSGVRLNVSKSGVSTSFRAPGASINVGRRGVRTTVGIPGTGISYTRKLGAKTRGGESGNLLHLEIFAISAATGWHYHSWWVFGGLLLDFILALSIRPLQVLLVLLLSAAWAIPAYFLATDKAPWHELSTPGLVSCPVSSWHISCDPLRYLSPWRYRNGARSTEG